MTLLVLTDNGEGLPVAWLISNREDETAMAVMVRGLMSACSEGGHHFPDARYLMSDKAQAFFNAWTNTTGQDTQHLLCAWHVHKAWRGQLATITVSIYLRNGAVDLPWRVYSFTRFIYVNVCRCLFTKI